MFNKLFRKKKDSEQPDTESSVWSVYQGQFNNSPVILRCNSYYREYKGKKEYPYQVGVAMPLNLPNEMLERY